MYRNIWAFLTLVTLVYSASIDITTLPPEADEGSTEILPFEDSTELISLDYNNDQAEELQEEGKFTNSLCFLNIPFLFYSK